MVTRAHTFGRELPTAHDAPRCRHARLPALSFELLLLIGASGAHDLFADGEQARQIALLDGYKQLHALLKGAALAMPDELHYLTNLFRCNKQRSKYYTRQTANATRPQIFSRTRTR